MFVVCKVGLSKEISLDSYKNKRFLCFFVLEYIGEWEGGRGSDVRVVSLSVLENVIKSKSKFFFKKIRFKKSGMS